MPITLQAIENADTLKIHTDRLEHLEKMLNQWTIEEKKQAVVIKVNRFGTTIFEGAYGKNTKDSLLSCDTIFSVASNTKPIIATLLMILQEDGLLDLTDPVNKYIPEFTGEGKEKICLWHFLCHTSGIMDDDIEDCILTKLRDDFGCSTLSKESEWDDIEPIIKEVTEKLGLVVEKDHYYDALKEKFFYKAPIKREPRSAMSYCNFGYQLLKDIICDITGESIDSFASRKLFIPLSMNDTYFKVPVEKYERILGRNERCEGYPYINSEDCYTSESGSGGLKSTPNDMVKFLDMIANDGLVGDTRILSKNSIKSMKTNQNEGVGTEFDSWTLGFNYRGTKKDDSGILRSSEALDHGGWAGTKILLDPQFGLTAALYTAEYKDVSFNIYGRAFNILYSALD